MVFPFDRALEGINARFQTMQGGGSPFGQNPFGAVSPFANPFGQGSSPGFQGMQAVQGPGFQGFGNMQSPFGNPFGNTQSPFGNPFGGGSNPFGSSPWGNVLNPYTYDPNASNDLGTGGGGDYGDVGFTSTSDGSADAGTGRWRPQIEDVARKLGIEDPDVIQAIMMIESQGNPQAGSSQGAIGLMQIIPAYHAHRIPGGGDPWEPYNNIYAGAHFLKELYQKWGSWEKAAAGYLGGLDANGNFSGAADANGTTGAKYAAMFNENMRKLKSTGVRNVPGGGTNRGNWEATARSFTREGGGWVDYTNGGIRITGNPKDGMDCSSFTGYVLGLDRNIWTAQAQANAAQSRGTRFMDRKQAKKGDLIFFHSTYDTGRGERVTHVGIYLGNGKMIHTGTPGRGVEVVSIDTQYWKDHFDGFGRL